MVYAGVSLLLALASLGLSVGMEKIMLVAFLPALMMGVYARSQLGAMGGLVFGFGIGLALPMTRPASVAEGLAWFSAALVSAAASAVLIEITAKRNAALASDDEQNRNEAPAVSHLVKRIDSELLSNISHELRTPMYGIVGMTELALNEDVSPSLRDYLQTAQNAADMLLVLVDEILDYLKLESGEFELQPATIKLYDLVEEVVRCASVAGALKGLLVTAELGAGVPQEVVADGARLRQVLLDLLGNAVKFTDEGSVALRVFLKSRRRDHVRLDFEIADTGIGIAPEHLHDIFAPFTQVDSSSTRRHGGTGLGLTIAKRLVELMQGSFHVQSTPGQGSVFSFDVLLGLAARQPGRRHRQSGKASRPPDDSADACPPMRVLLAEDTPANQKIVRNVLAKRGHQVEVASDGRQVLEKVRSKPFDVVLMDVQMPCMDGFAATVAIRALEAQLARHVPIVAMTAHAMQGDRERCLAAGMDAYLAKPVSISSLVQTVESFSAYAYNRPSYAGNDPPGSARASQPAPALATEDDRVFNFNSALARLGNDRNLFADLVTFFMEDAPELLSAIRTGLDNGNADDVMRASHSLKGLLSSFDAHQAVSLAARIENAAREGDLVAACEVLPRLEDEVTRLQDLLHPYGTKAEH
jgi:signal transduction histidine kinase/DNA-binding response OmpR family regulator